MGRLIQNLHDVCLENRTDWLAIQTFIIAEHLCVKIPSRLALMKAIKDKFIQDTEQLAKDAWQNDGVEMGEISDVVKTFYSVLPANFFANPLPPEYGGGETSPEHKPLPRNQPKNQPKVSSLV